MKKILIPTDRTELGDYAYELAHNLAKRTQATIDILSIVPAPEGVFYDTAGNLKNDEGEDFSAYYLQQENLQKSLDQWRKDKPGIQSVQVKIGRVNEDILHHIQANNIDLVVMGTSGAHGLDQMLRGSHAEYVVRNSPVPVLSLKCDRSGMLIKDLLLVCDFEELIEIDLSIVKEIQAAFDAKLHLLRINTPRYFETSTRIKLNMQKFAVLHALENVDFHIYCDNTVEDGVVHFSTESGIDFVAMGTHQRKGLGRLLKHSISENIVNHVWQPVLVFPV